MARRGKRAARMRLAQRIIAVVLLLTLTLSGLAIYASANNGVTQQPTQQSH